MQVTKYETNYRKKIFFKESTDIVFKLDKKNEENKLINIYPLIEFQSIIGFGGALTRFYLF